MIYTLMFFFVFNFSLLAFVLSFFSVFIFYLIAIYDLILGCLDVSVKMNTPEDVYKALYHHFPNSSYATNSNSVFQCAYSCTSKGDLFTFHVRILRYLFDTMNFVKINVQNIVKRVFFFKI